MKPMLAEHATLYRSFLTRVAMATTLLTRRMAPTSAEWQRLENGRRPRGVTTYRPQKSQPEVLIEVGSDFAGDLPSRRSMTEVASFDRDHLLKITQRAAIYSEPELW